MKNVLVDSSVWIEYFRGRKEAATLDELIDKNQLCINNLIQSELIPFLRMKKESTLISILMSIKNSVLKINWEEIIDFQEINLRNGINKIGIADLIIVQNARDNNLCLYSFDKHFKLMNRHIQFDRF